MIARIVHINLAFLLLLSSTGIVLNKHYCGAELKSIGVFIGAEPCHHEKAMKGCPYHDSGEKGLQKEKKGCCNDETEYIKSDEDKVAPSVQGHLKSFPVLLAAVFVVLDIELPSTDSVTLRYLTYKPPAAFHDLSVLLQVFRL
ncbi:MAG: hypothetical protein KDD06_12465 [Phaeodactylibacter sp.]|nr:hypothetical protein [Phaeodactylibacter sp.]MCB9266079.1 hypothetical protein [Lewinellaceae bacterium]MCB9289376.1 hypothetical protein [Lewinellaceae bacterium]